MPTYIYETVPTRAGEEPRRFEIFQGINEPSLQRDPDSGQPVRQVIPGGIALKVPGLRRSTVFDKRSPAATACRCSAGGSHKHRHT